MHYNFFKNSIKKSKGFTIIETLVAITILMIAITGPLTIASKALTTAINARDQVVATFLVQDVHEYIHNIKDRNIYAGNAWLTDLGSGSSCTQSAPCIIDTSGSVGAQTSAVTANANNQRLYKDGFGRFTHISTNTTPTQFYRTFYIEQSSEQDFNQQYMARVVVTVRWSGNGINFDTTFDSYVYRVVQ